MKKLVYLEYSIAVVAVLSCAIAYIRAICFFTRTGNSFILLLVVFWGPVATVTFVYIIIGVFKGLNKHIKRTNTCLLHGALNKSCI